MGSDGHQLQRLVITSDQVEQSSLRLTSEQHHYLTRVLRLQPGDTFIAINGQGQTWLAELGVDQRQAQLVELAASSSELPLSVSLRVALPKGNSFDEIVRQATELGVTELVPILSDRTLLNPSAHKLTRWRRIAQEAAEQSERQIIPRILEPMPFADGLQINDASSSGTVQRYVCVTRCSAPHLLDCLLTRSVVAAIQVFTGPEGGWTDAEVELATAAGCQLVSLGPRILRAVTAPVAVLALVGAALERDKPSSQMKGMV